MKVYQSVVGTTWLFFDKKNQNNDRTHDGACM